MISEKELKEVHESLEPGFWAGDDMYIYNEAIDDFLEECLRIIRYKGGSKQ